LAYCGKWSTVSVDNASGGKYRVGQTKGGQRPILRLKFFGRAVKLEYPTKSDGGVGEVFLDGQSHGIVNFYRDETQFGNRTVFAGLDEDEHTLELRLLMGKTSDVQVVEEIATAPRHFELFQNYPNPFGRLPFNPETTIEYTLPSAGDVQLVILNTLGQEVARLVNGWQAAGRYRANWSSSRHPSGVYFCRLRAEGFEQTRKMSVVQ
jgi:hypothetical protein